MNKETENIKKLIIDQTFELDCGKTIKDFPLAYETYGTLNNKKSNAILVFHALTGDQFVQIPIQSQKEKVGGLLRQDLEKQLIQTNIL